MPVFDPTALRAQLRSSAKDAQDEFQSPSFVLGVEDGARSVRVATGVVDPQAPTPAHADNTFEIGSNTKMLTATVVLQLAEEGRIDLNAPLADYVPAALIEGIENADTATIEQFLAMESGVRNYTEVLATNNVPVFFRYPIDRPNDVFSTEQALNLVRGEDGEFSPGAQQRYSNTNYALLGRMIEEVEGEDLGRVLDKRIFTPLGMDSTFLNDERQTDPRLHSIMPALAPGEGPTDVTYARVLLFAEGGVISTVADMAKFMDGLLGERTLLSEASLKIMTNFDRAPAASDSTFGGRTSAEDPVALDMGVGLGRFRMHSGEEFYGFTGGTLGSTSYVMYDPENGRSLVAGTTTRTANIAEDLALALEAFQDDPLWRDDLSEPVIIENASASDAQFSYIGGEATLSFDGIDLKIEGALADLNQGQITFADGSELIIGFVADERLIAPHNAQAASHQLLGRGGDDLMRGGAGDELLLGGTGDDIARGRAGDDTLSGGAGEDRLLGGAGRDKLHGNTGDDVLRGGADNDLLRGDAGDDRLIGGGGRDRLHGGAGDDRLIGGGGDDAFIFTARDASNGVKEHDVIHDFNIELDELLLRGLEIKQVKDVSGGALVELSGEDGDTIKLLGVEAEFLL